MDSRNRYIVGCSIGLAAGLLFAACGNGKSTSGAADDDGGSDAAAQNYSFSPQGCAYKVTVPASRAFTDFASDDTTSVGDPTAAAPMRVRVGLGGGTTAGQPGYADPTTTAAFTWETGAANHAAKVQFGASAAALGNTQSGYSWTAPPQLGGSATSNYFHEVHICGLSAGTTYYYRVGGGPTGQEVWSAVQSFTTVPASGPITVGVLGDARDQVTTWQLVHERMRDAAVSMQLIGGDIVDIGALSNLWGQWLDAIWKDPSDATKFLTLGQQMIVPIAGNHENEAADFYANFAIPGDTDYAEQYASFDVGNTHFVLVDDQPISLGANDTATAIETWLDQDLSKANANRAKVPFIVVISHRGIYSTSNHAADGDVLLTRGVLAPLYDKYNVDVAMNGHDHEYERSNPLHAGSPASGAPVVGAGTTYIICAGAGAEPYAVGTAAASYSAKTASFGGSTPYVGTYSLLKLNGSTLTVTAYGLKAGGAGVADDDVLDTSTFTH